MQRNKEALRGEHYGGSFHTFSGKPSGLSASLRCLYTDTCSMGNTEEELWSLWSDCDHRDMLWYQWGRTRWSPEVPSNLNHAVILHSYGVSCRCVFWSSAPGLWHRQLKSSLSPVQLTWAVISASDTTHTNTQIGWLRTSANAELLPLPLLRDKSLHSARAVTFWIAPAQMLKRIGLFWTDARRMA